MTKILKSKTLWLNIIAAVVLFAQSQFGFAVPIEIQAYALAAINLLLRKVTNKPLEW